MINRVSFRRMNRFFYPLLQGLGMPEDISSKDSSMSRLGVSKVP